MDRSDPPLEIGKAELLRDGRDVAIVGIGQTVIPALGRLKIWRR
jgi:transketolase C-terminal domain/subunit